MRGSAEALCTASCPPHTMEPLDPWHAWLQGSIIRFLLNWLRLRRARVFQLLLFASLWTAFSIYLSYSFFFSLPRQPPKDTFVVRKMDFQVESTNERIPYTIVTVDYRQDISNMYKNMSSLLYFRSIVRKALVISQGHRRSFTNDLERTLRQTKIQCRVHYVSSPNTTKEFREPFPLLETPLGREFDVIIFAHVSLYEELDAVTRAALNDHCVRHNVGILMFVISDPLVFEGTSWKITGLDLSIAAYQYNHSYLYSARAVNSSSVLYLTKPDVILDDVMAYTASFDLARSSSAWVPLMVGSSTIASGCGLPGRSPCDLVLIVHHPGDASVPRRTLFGTGFYHFLPRMILGDVLRASSYGRVSRTLDSYIYIDIDDGFMNSDHGNVLDSDIEALAETQERYREYIPGFHFHVGFSLGKLNFSEIMDQMKMQKALLSKARVFKWFDHTYNHTQVDNGTQEEVEDILRKNKMLSKVFNLDILENYTVTPFHSGIYPPSPEAYEAMKNVWGISVTSTIRYPTAMRLNRNQNTGFIHRGIRVLPRENCMLSTRDVNFSNYIGGFHALKRAAEGGKVFLRLTDNMFNIFMTHLCNFGNDRLATFLFDHLLPFAKKWTNLDFIYTSPVEMANRFFSLYPLEEKPFWVNPCSDNQPGNGSHIAALCSRVPQFLIIGPQKTGITALHQFLSLHPRLVTSRRSEHFEETQFFSSDAYYLGPEWYLRMFPMSENNTIYFEKSSNYFSSAQAALRASMFLPNAKLVVVLTNPVRRAYSWYQHLRSKQDQTALRFSFREVIEARNTTNLTLDNFRAQILFPGLYLHHIKTWLKYYNLSNMIFLDGEELSKNPLPLLDELQDFLQVDRINYSEILRLNPKSGVFCPINGSRHSCLGLSEGRPYPAVTSRHGEYLFKYYRGPCRRLLSFFKRNSISVPAWLSSYEQNADPKQPT